MTLLEAKGDGKRLKSKVLLWRDAWGLDQVKKGLEEGGCLRLALQGLEALNGVEGQSVQENCQNSLAALDVPWA